MRVFRQISTGHRSAYTAYEIKTTEELLTILGDKWLDEDLLNRMKACVIAGHLSITDFVSEYRKFKVVRSESHQDAHTLLAAGTNTTDPEFRPTTTPIQSTLNIFQAYRPPKTTEMDDILARFEAMEKKFTAVLKDNEQLRRDKEDIATKMQQQEIDHFKMLQRLTDESRTPPPKYQHRPSLNLSTSTQIHQDCWREDPNKDMDSGADPPTPAISDDTKQQVAFIESNYKSSKWVLKKNHHEIENWLPLAKAAYGSRYKAVVDQVTIRAFELSNMVAYGWAHAKQATMQQQAAACNLPAPIVRPIVNNYSGNYRGRGRPFQRSRSRGRSSSRTRNRSRGRGPEP